MRKMSDLPLETFLEENNEWFLYIEIILEDIVSNYNIYVYIYIYIYIYFDG